MEHVDERLISVLNKVKNRIDKLQKQAEHFGEQDTKGVLIEPVLRALGWDTADYEDVRREYKYRSKDKPVDYALMIDGKPALFLEAKAIHVSLEDRKWVTQVVNYANTAGVQWCVLSNGDHYRVFNSHALVHIDEKLLCEFWISKDIEKPFITRVLSMLQQSELSTNALASMWNVNQIDKQVQQVVESFFEASDDSFIRLLKRRLPEFTPRQITNSIQRLWDRTQIASEVSEPAIPDSEKSSRRAIRRKKASPTVIGVSLADIGRSGIISLPLKLERTYKGHNLTATILKDGRISFDGTHFDSPSLAGGHAKNRIIGPPPGQKKYWSTNGWSFWRYQDSETGKLERLNHLRQKYLRNAREDSGLRVV